MIIKIISEIFGILFWYEVFEIRRVCVCVFFLNWDIVAHTRDFQGVNMSYFLTKSGVKRDEKNVIFGLRINFSMTERVAPSRHLHAVLLGESWTWPQEDRVLAHCSGEASDSRGQPWRPHVDTQTSTK